MKAYKLTTEHLLYWLVFLVALALRLFQLGAASLSDVEAGWALQALGLQHAGAVTLGAQPAYLLLTSQLFSIFGDTNFLARLFPALTGSLLVWLPFFFRRWMRDSSWLHRAGLVMAFGLAIDPGLVSLSRQVGSLMPALVFTLLALACLLHRRMVWTGICAGLALLSGLAFLQGLLILGISWGFSRLAGRASLQTQPDGNNAEPPVEPISTRSMGTALAALVGTVLVVGTLFLRLPQGLGALAGTIPAYLNTWVASSGIPVLRLPASLLVYQPLVLIFVILGAVRAWFGAQADQHTRQVRVGLSIWVVVAILLPLLYAGRHVGDMAWALIPLWALAAIEISRAWDLAHEDTFSRLVSAGLGLLLFVLAVVGWINLLSIGRYQVSVVVYWAIIIGALLLSIIAVLLVAATWSTSAARLGVVGALCIVLGLQLFANTWGMSIVRQNGAQELWPAPAATGQAEQLRLTLTDLSIWSTGLKDQLEIVSLVESSALQWELRHFPNARFETGLASSASPPVVITLKGVELPSLTEKYRGQDFIWRIYPGWQGVFPPGFINWLAFRQAPLGQEQIILWARADIFPGGNLETSGSVIP